jgi:hypothetical protein
MDSALELLKKFGITDEQIETHRKSFDEALSKATKEELLALNKLSTKPSPLTDTEKKELKALRIKVCGS